MSPRSDVIDAFLAGSGWAGARRTKLAGDASFRKYERVFLGDRQAVLMDAPPDKEDIRPFIHVARQLLAHEMSAPQILASDTTNGLLLLEDLGDDLFARVLQKNPAMEKEMYVAAADALVQLYEHASHTAYQGIPLFDNARYLQQVALLPEWFLPVIMDKQKAEALKQEYLELWQQLLARLPALRPVMVLYDFHAENLLWLPDRKASRRAGLLDFQDAMLGSPAYDMVSFLEDARRDVSVQTTQHIIDHHLSCTGIDRSDFMLAYAILGAQRNSRIVGTFVRLCVRDGKANYLSYMPRVWGHLERDLSHPALLLLKTWMDKNVPQIHRGVLRIESSTRATA